MAKKIHRLSTNEVVRNGEKIFHGLRWKYGIVVCPYCGSIHIKEYGGYHYKCNSCKNRFSDKTNTLMHGSKLSVGVWMQAIHEIVSDNFVSSVTLSKKLGINQKSAWLLRLKLDMCMNLDGVVMDGVICMDEMYIGGSLSNFHYRRKWDLLRKGKYIKGDEERYSKQAIFRLNSDLKTPVFGMTNGDKVVLHVCPNPIKKEHIRKLYKRYCKKGSVSVADESKLYDDWDGELFTNNHHDNQYITKEGLTSNAIENKFSWYKRGFYSRITHCKYHQLYLNEYCFRYNHRKLGTEELFGVLVTSTIGKHVTYQSIKEYDPFKYIISKTKRMEKERKQKKAMMAVKMALDLSPVKNITYKGKIYTPEDFK